MTLLEKIDREIEEEAKKYGFMGTESVSVSLTLTEDEIDEFHTLDLDNHYTWEINNNILDISYVEEI